MGAGRLEEPHATEVKTLGSLFILNLRFNEILLSLSLMSGDTPLSLTNPSG